MKAKTYVETFTDTQYETQTDSPVCSYALPVRQIQTHTQKHVCRQRDRYRQTNRQIQTDKEADANRHTYTYSMSECRTRIRDVACPCRLLKVFVDSCWALLLLDWNKKNCLWHAGNRHAQLFADALSSY